MDLDWTWRQLEATFAQVHDVALECRPAFNAKLRHLQRCGVLGKQNPGRGTAAVYGVTQVISMGFALELLQLGLTPELAAQVVERHWSELLEKSLLAAEDAQEPTRRNFDGRLLIFDPAGLAYLQRKRSSSDRASTSQIDPDELSRRDHVDVVSIERLIQNIIHAADVTGTSALHDAAVPVRDRLREALADAHRGSGSH
jgi:hypothetical protein